MITNKDIIGILTLMAVFAIAMLGFFLWYVVSGNEIAWYGGIVCMTAGILLMVYLVIKVRSMLGSSDSFSNEKPWRSYR